MDFEINIIFLIEPFFLHNQNVMTKTQVSWEQRELLRWNKKHFGSFLKGFQLSKIVSDLRLPFENCINLTGKYLCWSLFLIHRCFPVRFCKFFRISFFTEHLRWLLLKGFCEGASLVKILEFCHFDIFGINHRCFRKIDDALKEAH